MTAGLVGGLLPPSGVRLLGRDAELRQVEALLEAARDGRGGGLLVCGEPGIGKTTLLESATASPRVSTAAPDGFRVLRVDGYEAESAIPFAAVHRLTIPLREHIPQLPVRQQEALLVSAVPPFMLRTSDNPGGVPLEIFDGIRAGSLADRSQTYRDLADGPFFGNNRPGANVSQGIRDAFWLQSMASGHRSAYECIAAFSATDFRGDLAKFDIPTLVIHGDDDQVVPFEIGGMASSALVRDARLVVYCGAPHGITDTHKQQLGDDLLVFLKEYDG